MKYILIPISFILAIHPLLSQECRSYFNMNSWSMKANPEAIWERVDTSEVRQVEWGFPASLFVGNKNLINVRVNGKISVQGEEDNDFIGIVFGYNQPTTVAVDATYNFYLFDWKAEEENVAGLRASEGFRLSYYNGFISRENQRQYFYMEVDSPPIRDIIAKDYGDDKGWEYNREYEIELLFTQDRIEIYIDSVLIFEKNTCSTAGKFGFYTMSQPYVHFDDFYYEDYTRMYISEDTVCDGTGITFYPFNPTCGDKPAFINNVLWDFGDGNTSNALTPEYIYNEPGDYVITLIVNEGSNCADTLFELVRVNEIPVANLGDDMIIPVCTSVDLDAGNDGSNYLWSTGETTKDIQLINIPGDTAIWVIIDKHNCFDSDTINITVENPQTKLFMPNAFTPNNDGENDSFKPVGYNPFITRYIIRIFNRWGQLLYESSNPTEGWDGTNNGEPCPVASYTYSLSYKAETCNSNRQESFSGIVTLIR